jgi:hypothetical protein
MFGGNADELGESTTLPLEYPLVGTITPQKMKVYPKKPSLRKNTCTNKP